MLLVASETGHVYTFATKKLQPMITSESGKVSSAGRKNNLDKCSYSLTTRDMFNMISICCICCMSLCSP